MTWIIGTRGSALALWQARHVQQLLQESLPNQPTQIHVIQTTGDQDKTSPLHAIGGKGVFTKTIEQALLDGHIDMAVHSLKDMTSAMPDPLQLTAFLAAESPADAWISAEYPDFNQLPNYCTIATGSLRRAALVKRQHPTATIVPIRGNVGTRIKDYSTTAIGTFLSVAGLKRLGLQSRHTHPLPVQSFTPAPGQGVITVQTRRDADPLNAALSVINDPRQALLSRLELAFLYSVGLDCRAPLGAHAQLINNRQTLSIFLSTMETGLFMDECIDIQVDSDIKTLSDRCLSWLNENK